MRASASVLRPLSAVSNTTRRVFHESSKAKAVEAAVSPSATPFQPPPAPFSPAMTVTPAQRAPAAAASIKPAFTPQLNVLEEAYKPEFYATVAEIMKLRQKYVEDRSIFVEGKDMLRIVKGLGAFDSDRHGLEYSSDVLYQDPTLPFRKSRGGRFAIDMETNSLRRLEFQPFTLTAGEDFKRHDSGAIRRFDEILNNLQLNSMLQALFVFKAMIIHGVEIAHRPLLEYGTDSWVCTLFSLRTITTPEILGEPALEGVHSDGVDHTMTTFLKTENMAPNCAATFMHGMGETTGRQNKDLDPEHLLGRVQHKNFLDTLMIVDHERKHSLSPVHAIDPSLEAQRDMLVFFTRKPVHKEHVSGGMDSFVPHSEMPMEVPLYIPPYAKRP